MFNQEYLQGAYTFGYRSADGTRNLHYEISFEELTAWSDVHKSFIDFLGAVYGYDIHDRVKVNE